MNGHQQHGPTGFVIEKVQCRIAVAAARQRRGVEQRVDDRVAGDDDRACIDAFGSEVVARGPRRCEVKVGQLRREPAIHLLGVRGLRVARAQARFDMSNRNVVIEAG